MRQHFISFFYYNLVLLLFLILGVDFIVIVLILMRKGYVVFKESITELMFLELDALNLEDQTMDLHENKLYMDFGSEIGLEESHIQAIYFDYALSGFSLDFEAYGGNTTFKWADFDLEEFNWNKSNYDIFKKIYWDINFTKLNSWTNFSKELEEREIPDHIYTHLYNFKNMNRIEIEDANFIYENEKFFYNILNDFFLKKNFYDTYVEDNYERFLNYIDFKFKLEKKFLINKISQKERDIEMVKTGIIFLGMSNNIDVIKQQFVKKNFYNK